MEYKYKENQSPNEKIEEGYYNLYSDLILGVDGGLIYRLGSTYLKIGLQSDFINGFNTNFSFGAGFTFGSERN